DASLLEAADQQVVRELSATTSLHEHIIRSINPTLLILKKNAIEDLFDELKQRRQVPLLHYSSEIPLLTSRPEAQNESKSPLATKHHTYFPSQTYRKDAPFAR